MRWSALAWLVASMGWADPGDGMRKQDAVPPVFVAGVRAEAGAELDVWLAGHAGDEVRLPFTVWRGPIGEVERVAIGVVASAPEPWLRLDDTALGISLRDRLRGACGDEDRCVVLLSGRFGYGSALLGGDGPTFSVLAFHGALPADASPTAEAARRPECLAIRAMRPLHCARGPARCKDCREAAKAPATPRLLDVCPDDADLVARPVTEVVRDGRTEHRVYDVVRVFADEAEARAFATAHGIADVALDPR